jgi:hypothetical protein
MTAQELIEKVQEFLKAHPEAAAMQVLLEGCDCEGRWSGEIEISYGDVLLKR